MPELLELAVGFPFGSVTVVVVVTGPVLFELVSGSFRGETALRNKNGPFHLLPPLRCDSDAAGHSRLGTWQPGYSLQNGDDDGDDEDVLIMLLMFLRTLGLSASGGSKRASWTLV